MAIVRVFEAHNLKIMLIPCVDVKDHNIGLPRVCRLCGAVYRLADDLHAAGVPVGTIDLLVRAWRRAVTAAEDLEPLTQLFEASEQPGGATLAQVRAWF